MLRTALHHTSGSGSKSIGQPASQAAACQHFALQHCSLKGSTVAPKPAWMLMGGGTPSFAATSAILQTPNVVSLDSPQCRTCSQTSRCVKEQCEEQTNTRECEKREWGSKAQGQGAADALRVSTQSNQHRGQLAICAGMSTLPACAADSLPCPPGSAPRQPPPVPQTAPGHSAARR